MSAAEADPGEALQPADDATTVSTQFGRYRVCFELASGGMGTVFLGRAEGPHGYHKLVAIKRIHPHLSKDEKFVHMFLDEARIASRINHPNVCNVIDFGRAEDDTYYFAMDYLVGEPLSRIVTTLAKQPDPALRRRLPLMAARMIADACEGLHAAHELRGEDGQPLHVVHRDVSPHNLFATFDGNVRVLDFGVASARHRLVSTATGEIKGKFAYMAPEQLEAGAVDRRADVWALGCVLWEMVALRRLFGRPSPAESVRAVITAQVPALTELHDHVPLALEEVIFKALARDPARRYATARQMGRDLLAVLAEEHEPIGVADVAEWLEQLFPGVKQSKQQMVAFASTTPADQLGGLFEIEPTRQQEVSTSRAVPSSRSSRAPEAPRRRASPVLIGLLAAAAGAALALGVDQATTPEPSAAPAAAVPAPAPTEPSEVALGATEPAAQAARAPAPPPPEPATADPPPEPATADPPPEPATADPPPEQGRRSRIERERDPPQARPRTDGFGTVNVATPGGWALVFHNGRRIGEAPGSFRLPAGRQILQVQPFGRGARQSRAVRVSADETSRLSVAVRP